MRTELSIPTTGNRTQAMTFNYYAEKSQSCTFFSIGGNTGFEINYSISPVVALRSFVKKAEMDNIVYNFENISKLCIICLTESKNMTDIHEINKPILDLLNDTINFKVSNELLNKLCLSCKEKLEMAYDIIELAKRSQEIIEAFGQCKIVNAVLPSSESKLVEFTYDDIMTEIRNVENLHEGDANCIRCDFVGINVKALISHMSLVHKESKEKWCSLCNELQEDLSVHKRTHRNSGLRCKFCGSNFSIRNNLVQHLLNHSKNLRLSCGVCCKNFASQRSLDRHEISHNDEEYRCTSCGKNFRYKIWFDRHANVCGKTAVSFDRHEISRNDEEYPCTSCGKNFRYKIWFDRHAKVCGKRDLSFVEDVVQDVEELDRNEKKRSDPKLCTTCGKQFPTSSRLHAHMRTHSQTARYVCRFCDKGCTTRGHLITHERIHTGERPYVCNLCDKNFNQSSILKTHQKTHAEKLVPCGICDKKFTRNCELKVHLRTHTGEKPFQCQMCDKAFVQRSHLLDHEKTHLYEKPYKCLYCDRAFAQKSTLKTHIAIHLGIKSYKCDVCPYSARQSYVLKMHMKQHERELGLQDSQ